MEPINTATLNWLEKFLKLLRLILNPGTPLPPPEEPMPEPDFKITLYGDWDTPKHAWHNTRVLCDRALLSVEEKNLLCACIYQESRFLIHAMGRNYNKLGKLMSTDWGICQINDYYNIGAGKPFPSVDFVLNNPQDCVEFMIKCYKQGQLKLWSSYKFGAYKQWLVPSSEMWKLAL